jgi:hypothetical protein
MTEMNDAVRERLRELVHQQGPAIIDQPYRLRSLLADALPDHLREQKVLAAALDEGVVAELRDQPAGTPLSAARVGQLAGRLERERGLSMDASRWAVETWSFALGHSSSVPTPPPVDATLTPADAGYVPPVVSPATPPHTTPPAWQTPTVGTEAPEQGGMPRWVPPAIGIALLALIVIAVLALLNVVGGDGDEDESSEPSAAASVAAPSQAPSEAPPSESAPSAPPPSTTTCDAACQDLVALIPPAHGVCDPDPDDAYADANASVRCDPGGDLDALWFDQFASIEDMDAVMDGLIGDEPEGRCDELTDARGTWNFEDTPDISEGEIGCYSAEDGAQYLLWSDWTTLIIGTAVNNAGDNVALYNWWANAEKPGR